MDDFRPGRFAPGHLAPEPHDGRRPDGEDSVFVHVIGATVWLDERSADGSWPQHFLGRLDGRPVWAVDVPHGVDPADGAASDLYGFYGRADEAEWAMAGRAVQIVEWARTHRFCGRCATANVAQRGERAMRCPACGLLAFPRLAPAMITLVTRRVGDQEEALLARGVQFRGPMFSCLAGFVEPGESLEQAVRREVAEEVGVRVGEVRYVASQPWPFPHSLMVGFRARLADDDPGELACDPAEIVEAGWFTRQAVRNGTPAIPPPISIARRLIDGWLDE